MEKERFSLLLLEPGEFYFEDFSVCLLNDGGSTEDGNNKNSNGRLKICSKSLVYDPKRISEPIIKIPLKECIQISKCTARLTDGRNEILSTRCNQYVEMLEGNVLAPYVFKNKSCNFLFSFNYANVEDHLPHICQLHRASTLPIAEQNQMIAAIAYARQCRIKFDLMWLENLEERIVLDIVGSKVTPLVVNPGRIVLSSLNLYFQPFNNIEPQQYLRIHLSEIKSIIKRRFLLQHLGLELYCKEGCSLSHIYLSLNSAEAREKLYDNILSQPELKLDNPNQDIMTLQWQNGTISNYDYLLYINSLGDRTFNDLTQYPIFPWVISDYTSSELDLQNPIVFRDLTKPIGALNPERLERLKERYNEMSLPKFLYGSHYSTPGFVLFYLVRKYPHYMLCLQNGRFDHPDRMFNSIRDIWRNVLTNMSDFKELVPEFYDVSQEGDFLENKYGINFGHRHDGSHVGDVALPPWSTSPKDFVSKLRQALETDYVSSKLHHWIDLIFGYKQSGEEAEKANNKFYYLCYEGAVNLDSIKDWNQRHALEIQIMEFGQIPKKVFFKPHPARTCSIMSLHASLANLGIGDYSKDWSNSIVNLQPSFCSQSHKDFVTDVAISADLMTVFSVSKDTFLKMYNIGNFKQERSVTLSRMALSSIILLEDNATAIIGSWDSSVIVYDIECGRVMDVLRGHEDAVCCIAWCSKKKYLISASWDCTVRVWKASLPWIRLKPTSAILAQLHHDTRIPCLDVSKNEELLATGTESGNIFIWSLDTYKVTLKLTGHINKVTSVRFSKQAERLISCSTDHTFRVFDLSTGMQVYSKNLNQELNCIAWDGNYVLIGGNSILFFWDLLKNNLLKQPQAHTEAITAISASPDGTLVVTAGEDNRIVIWQTST